MEKTNASGLGDFVWWLAPTNFAQNPAQKMRVSNNGDISFYEDTGTTPKFFWDASTERLGIGNSSPTSSLDVTGQISFGGVNRFVSSTNQLAGAVGQNGVVIRSAISSAAVPSFSNVDDNNTGMFLPGSDVIGFTTGGTERMRIDASGNLLVGVTLGSYGAVPSDCFR
jgi:hypothetical protein